MLNFYQNLPNFFDPIAFSIGFFSIRWYALLYLFSFVFIAVLVFWRIKRGEDLDIFKNGEKSIKSRYDFIFDIMLIGIFGVLMGGRIGYAIFYDISFFWKNPLALIYPINIETGEYIGIFGMSYFGAVIGIIIVEYLFLRKKQVSFWKVGDFFIPVIAGAYFFGRIGNFINGELFGVSTNHFLGMRFGQDGFLRHPSQLYEAFFEGIVLFILLWIFRNRARFEGQLVLLYFMGYSLFRFFLEFFRNQNQNEVIINGFLTKGQFFSFILFFISLYLYLSISKKSQKML